MLSSESFTRWLTGAWEHEGTRERESNILVSPLYVNVKSLNEFDYRSLSVPALYMDLP